MINFEGVLMIVRNWIAGLLLSALLPLSAQAEPQTVRIAKQFGVSYLPLIIMQEEKLLEAEGKSRGLDLVAEFLTIGNGGAINDALISGNLDFASGGVGPMLTIWGKTRTNLKVKGVATLNAMPIWLNTSNPKIKTIKDFSDTDRIALPAVKITIQAIVLQMAAAAEFGPANFDQLDRLTVSLGHPDAFVALMSFRSEINSHFTSAPFMYQELEDSRIHRVLNSYDVLGGPHTFNAVWATTKFHDANPKVTETFLAALDRAQKMIVADPTKAAELYIRNEKSKIPLAKVLEIIKLPENEWTMVPKQVMKFATFMNQTGAVSTRPDSWKDLFFTDIHNLAGN
jgi:NitT/TauT family transport system substrate-binding protein